MSHLWKLNRQGYWHLVVDYIEELMVYTFHYFLYYHHTSYCPSPREMSVHHLILEILYYYYLHYNEVPLCYFLLQWSILGIFCLLLGISVSYSVQIVESSLGSRKENNFTLLDRKLLRILQELKKLKGGSYLVLLVNSLEMNETYFLLVSWIQALLLLENKKVNLH
jgi:hypothetical protein